MCREYVLGKPHQQWQYVCLFFVSVLYFVLVIFIQVLPVYNGPVLCLAVFVLAGPQVPPAVARIVKSIHVSVFIQPSHQDAKASTPK